MGTVNTNKKAAYSFCNPAGLVGIAVATNDVAANSLLYTTGGNDNNPWMTKAFAGAKKSKDVSTKAHVEGVTKVWDPIMAAQLTEGGFCCNALYYSTDGVGRAAYKSGGTSGGVTYKGTGSISTFTPPLSGGNMVGEDSPGGMCPAHSSGDGYSTKTDGSAALTNPAMTELLEGQAFYAALAPSQYSLPTTSTTATTQAARAAKQRKCADAITSMMKLNKKSKVDAAAGHSASPTLQSNFRFGRLALGLVAPRPSTQCRMVTATPTPALRTSLRSARNPPSRGQRSLVSS